MIEFKSVISFDCETTGLPIEEHNQTKIIELAFIGCEVDYKNKTLGVPRVLHKLLLCFNPQKLISHQSSQICGLDNELLQNLKPFTKEDFEILKNFIKRLPPPVCIVAHNGKKFDFPILQRELKKISCNFPDDVYCVDSLKAFQEIFPKMVKKKRPNVSHKSQQVENETTPKHNKTEGKNMLRHKPYEIENIVRRSLTPEVCRELFPEEKDQEIVCLYQNIQIPDDTIESHKLKDIYFLLFKEYFPAHEAESDAYALLKCIFKCDKFLDWMNKNAVLLNSIEPLF